MFDYRKFIVLTESQGTITFNNQKSLHTALQQVYPKFKSLSFFTQMKILGEATIILFTPNNSIISTQFSENSWYDLDTLKVDTEFPPREFWYDFEWTVDDHLIIKVYEPESGRLIFLGDGTHLLTEQLIFDAFDIDGIRIFLIKIGELLPGDTLVMGG